MSKTLTHSVDSVAQDEGDGANLLSYTDTGTPLVNRDVNLFIERFNFPNLDLTGIDEIQLRAKFSKLCEYSIGAPTVLLTGTYTMQLFTPVGSGGGPGGQAQITTEVLTHPDSLGWRTVAFPLNERIAGSGFRIEDVEAISLKMATTLCPVLAGSLVFVSATLGIDIITAVITGGGGPGSGGSSQQISNMDSGNLGVWTKLDSGTTISDDLIDFAEGSGSMKVTITPGTLFEDLTHQPVITDWSLYSKLKVTAKASAGASPTVALLVIDGDMTPEGHPTTHTLTGSFVEYEWDLSSFTSVDLSNIVEMTFSLSDFVSFDLGGTWHFDDLKLTLT